ncbi:hypothetical protein MN608_11665 [Microdochium nivale]|nr:hypothetical protein MN608_11665 [Microdochium nivale]
MFAPATFVLGLFAAVATASAIPAPLAARLPDVAPEGVIYQVIAPEDIPEYIKTGANATDIEARGEVDAAGLAKRANHGVYFCTNRNWTGYCVYITAPAGVCVPLASDLNDLVSSLGPDAGAYCRFNFDYGCPSNSCDHFDLTAPGDADLDRRAKVCGINSANDKVSSYQCWDY